jgi:hypothetical protein
MVTEALNMSLSAKREYLAKIHGRYQRAGRPHINVAKMGEMRSCSLPLICAAIPTDISVARREPAASAIGATSL